MTPNTIDVAYWLSGFLPLRKDNIFNMMTIDDISINKM